MRSFFHRQVSFWQFALRLRRFRNFLIFHVERATHERQYSSGIQLIKVFFFFYFKVVMRYSLKGQSAFLATCACDRFIWLTNQPMIFLKKEQINTYIHGESLWIWVKELHLQKYLKKQNPQSISGKDICIELVSNLKNEKNQYWSTFSMEYRLSIEPFYIYWDPFCFHVGL